VLFGCVWPLECVIIKEYATVADLIDREPVCLLSVDSAIVLSILLKVRVLASGGGTIQMPEKARICRAKLPRNVNKHFVMLINKRGSESIQSTRCGCDKQQLVCFVCVFAKWRSSEHYCCEWLAVSPPLLNTAAIVIKMLSNVDVSLLYLAFQSNC